MNQCQSRKLLNLCTKIGKYNNNPLKSVKLGDSIVNIYLQLKSWSVDYDNKKTF